MTACSAHPISPAVARHRSLVPGAGFEPACPDERAADFKSAASACFAIRAGQSACALSRRDRMKDLPAALTRSRTAATEVPHAM